MKKKLTLLAGIFFVMIGLNPAHAKSDYEFIFFGINVNHLKDSKPIMLAAGALASVAAHELGHMLYLESQGKSWDLQTSMSSGLAVHTPDQLNDDQLQYFGRSGFLLQTSLGTLLACLPGTRNSDFTKGWVAMNTFQIWTYDVRSHDIGDDFDLIEEANGDVYTDRMFLSLWSRYNLRVLRASEPGYQYPPQPIPTMPAFSETPPDVSDAYLPWEEDILPASMKNAPHF